MTVEIVMHLNAELIANCILMNFPLQFDKELLKRWNYAMESGCFKYNLDSVERRIIPGKFGFVAQVIWRLFLSAKILYLNLF